MPTIQSLLSKLQSLNTDDVINQVFDDTSEDLAAINRERMLDGQKADGSTMPNYSKVSQEKFGYPDSPIMLKATGEFQAKIDVKRNGDLLTTDSADSKSQMLQERYGLIFGTYGDYKKQYLDENYRPAFNKKITDLTGLKFTS